MVLEVKNSLLQYGKVIRGWLGVSIQDLSEDLGKSMNIAARTGVLVSDVSADSPAAAAGLKRGDIITAIDGAKTTDSAHLRNLIALAGKSKKVRIDLLRDGKARTLEATLGEAPAELAGHGGPPAEGTKLFAGVVIEELDGPERARLRIPSTVRGVLVARIDPGSAGEGTGLRPGDIIVEVDRKETPTLEAFQKAANATGSRALLLVFRDGVTIFLSVSNPAP
jgi:serine protease Do